MCCCLLPPFLCSNPLIPCPAPCAGGGWGLKVGNGAAIRSNYTTPSLSSYGLLVNDNIVIPTTRLLDK